MTTQGLAVPLRDAPTRVHAARLAGRIAIAGAMAFIVLLALLHVIKPGLDPAWVPISEYAIGPYGWVMSAAFLAAGMAVISLAVALGVDARNWPGRIGLATLTLSGAGFLLAGVFTTDSVIPGLAPDEPTVSGGLHSLGATLGGLLPLAAVLLLWGIARNPRWRGHRRWFAAATAAVWAGELSLVAAMATMLPAANGELGPDVLIGWPGRWMIAACAGWLAIVAWRVLRMCGDRQ